MDTGMLDGDSGVMGPDGVKLSFGERSGATLPQPLPMPCPPYPRTSAWG